MVDPKTAIDRISAVFGSHGARALHAKGRFYTGTFIATDAARTVCRAQHLQGDPVPVVVRLSNGSGNPEGHDSAPDVRGMAVSFRLPDGTATDILGQTAPRFPVRTPEAFLRLVEASTKPHRLPFFLARHRDAVPALIANARAKSVVPPYSYAEATYYAIHAYKWWGPHDRHDWVRYRLEPLSTKKDRLPEVFTGRDRLQEEFAARVAEAPVRFAVEAQLAGPDDDPHDPMSTWGRDARFLEVGELQITDPAPDQEKDGPFVFDPTRVVDGIELSDDPILHYRAAAYSESVNRRA